MELRHDPHEHRTCAKCKHSWRYDPSAAGKASLSFKCPRCGSLAAGAGSRRRAFQTRSTRSGWTTVWGAWGLVAAGLAVGLLVVGATAEGAVVCALGVVWGLLGGGLYVLRQRARAQAEAKQAKDAERAKKRMQKASERLERDA